LIIQREDIIKAVFIVMLINQYPENVRKDLTKCVFYGLTQMHKRDLHERFKRCRKVVDDNTQGTSNKIAGNASDGT